MGRLTSGETLSEKRTYRKFSAQQKSELVLASLRGQRSIAELCRDFGGGGGREGGGECGRSGVEGRGAKREVEVGGNLAGGSEGRGPASWSRKAALPRSSPASRGSAAKRSTAARPARRRASGGR